MKVGDGSGRIVRETQQTEVYNVDFVGRWHCNKSCNYIIRSYFQPIPACPIEHSRGPNIVIRSLIQCMKLQSDLPDDGLVMS